jgi:predicted ATPase/transcriptional regulator with XRE-family HTH domain
LRTAADLTQEELAERAGVSARLVSDLERGAISRPRRETVRMLADGLSLTETDREAFALQARGRPAAGEPAMDAVVPPRRGQLPRPPSTLVGRDREVAAVSSFLMQPALRLLTLVGPGGVGKTRLALDVAYRVSAAFPNGVWFVDLAPVVDPAVVLPTIAQTLGVRERGGRALRDSLVDSLRGQRLLVVLDNVEHLTAAAPALADLLAACVGLTMLATSRQPLRLRAEREYAVAPLALPDLERLPSTDDLVRIPAVDLFVRRAEAARPSFALTAENAPTVAEIAVRLDGLPLAIELAAARVKVLSPPALVARLERRLPLLTGGARDLPARQQTLRATLDWSHDLLTPDEQTLFRRLAVFAGGFTLEAAESVCEGTGNGEQGTGRGPSPVPSVLDRLASLVDQCLLRVLDQDDDTRFGMLETVREYGLTRLAAAGEEVAVRDRHAAWGLALAEQVAPGLMGPDQKRCLGRLTAEHDNLRAALGWAIARENGEPAARLVGTLYRFWSICGHLAEGRRWLEQALAQSEGVPPLVRARALLGVAVIAYRQRDYARAPALEEALTLFRAEGDTAGVASALGNLGMVANDQGDTARAVTLYEESLALFRAVGDRTRVGIMLLNLGLAAYDQHDYERAGTLLEESLSLSREMGASNSVAYSLNNLALVALAQGDHARAARFQTEALELWRWLGNKDGLAHCFENLAFFAAAMGEFNRAARLLGAAEALRAEIGAPGRLLDQDFNERRIAEIRERLGDAVFTTVWEAGRAMTLDDAIDYALDPSHRTAAVP